MDHKARNDCIKEIELLKVSQSYLLKLQYFALQQIVKNFDLISQWASLMFGSQYL